MIWRNGLIKQWGEIQSVVSPTEYKNFPIAFSNKHSYSVIASYQERGSNGACGCVKISASQYLPYSTDAGGRFVVDPICWFAVGF